MAIDLDALFPKIVDLLLDPVFVVDETGQIVFVSDACRSLLGYQPDELVGTRVLDHVHPEDRERTRAAAERIMRGGSHIDFENRYVRKDGGVVHILWSARWSEEHRVRIAVARDVTSLKRAENVRAALYRISEAAHAADSLPTLCGAIHRVIAGLLPADKFYVALYDAAGNTISWPYFADDRQLPRVPEPLEEDTAIAQVIRSGCALLASRDNHRLDAGPVRAPSGTLDDWLGVPLVTGKDVMGVVVLENASQGEPYTDKHRDLLQFVSTQIAAAIERKQAQERLLHMANHDALTGLANRALFYDRLKMALHRARREGECLGLLYLDLDDLKTVNDSLGHQAGDRLLCELADRLVACTRASDTVARMGGDEFTILLTGVTDASGVDVVIGKVREALVDSMKLEDRVISLSVSIGRAVYPDDGELPDSLVRRADADMYEHKRRLRAG